MSHILLLRLLVAAFLCAAALPALADTSAFQLMKEGNRYIGEQSKDQVVYITSEKSIGGLTPSVWTVVYRDETATFKTVQVKFGGGKMMDVKRPFRVAEIAEKSSAFDRKRLNTDSDKALKIVQKEELVQKVKLVAAQMRLTHEGETPVWKIRLWAERQKQPGKSADIGEAWVDCESGKVSRLNLNINKVD
jgi:hypothetical protein